MKKTALLLLLIFGNASYNVYSQGIIKTILTANFTNCKIATPYLTKADIAAGIPIDFTIKFVNTSQDTVQNLVVIDTLSTLLQCNTIQFVASSHNCILMVNDNFIRFEFRNINLPDSSKSKTLCMGYVTFKVMANDGLANGTQITNKASICFDKKQPIVTNTTVTIINPIVTPVKIINYEISNKNEHQILNSWQTLLELNASCFNVQRSINGNEFLTVGKINATGIHSYSFVDVLPNLTAPELYYRLEIVDKDGSKTYSEVKRIKNQFYKNNLVGIYPNPASNEIKISRNGAIILVEKVTIINAIGKVIKDVYLSKSLENININNLVNGLYFVVFENGEHLKFVKQ